MAPRPVLPDNFGKVEEGLYRGGQPNRAEIKELALMGVRTVVNLRTSNARAEGRDVKAAGMAYVSIPIERLRAPTDDEVARFLAVVEKAESRPVYVHCLAGKHRTGTIVALYRVLRQAMHVDDAYAEMQVYRFGSGHARLRNFLYARAEGIRLKAIAEGAVAVLETPGEALAAD